MASTSSTQGASSSQEEPKIGRSICEQRETRITKENLYMVLALWMEKFPSNSQPLNSFKKVGVLFVLPNDRVLAADCSRDGVHGVARVMIKHCGKLQGCKVFISRKPCSLCAKLLVQSRVSRVFYLPIEPESADSEEELARVNNLFKVSPVGQSVFVPCVEEKVLTNAEKKLPLTITPEDISSCRDKLFEDWWSAEWINERAQSSLPWSCLNDKMKIQVKQDFMSLMKWIAVVQVPFLKDVLFREVIMTDSGELSNSDKQYRDPELAAHMMIFARMLARQTDDPKTGVGAVLMKGREFVSLGWNGFPSKALYGEFPRASDDDNAPETKYPYVIHAEQNALLVRNTEDLTDGVLFVTKSPCDECAPMVKLSGVRTVVVGETVNRNRSQGGKLSYKLFKQYIKDKDFSCFEMTRKKTQAKRPASDPEIRKKFSQEKSVKT